MDHNFKYSNTNKRYYTFDYYLKNKYNSKVFKIPLNADFTCPNRDGSKGYGGCYFCDAKGGGNNLKIDLEKQFEIQKEILHRKWKNAKYIAYFQSFSNTYGNVSKLKETYEHFLNKDNLVGLYIATRPDCFNKEIFKYLYELNKKTDLFIELGLQTTYDKTAKSFNRGYKYADFKKTVKTLRKNNINVCVHLINGLTDENEKMMLNNLKKLNKLDIQAIKFHYLNITKNSIYGRMYNENPFKILSREEYINIVIKQLMLLKENIIIMRINSDPIKEDLIEPLWNIDKVSILNSIDKEMKKRNITQGMLYKK